MDTVIVSSLISAVSAILVCLISSIWNNKLIAYRLEQLEKKMDKHNSVIDRVYKLEKDVAVLLITWILMTESEGIMFKMSNEVYDVLKEIALTILPALAVLYATLGKIWGFPYVGEVPATIMAIDTFLGVCLHISTSEYNKGGDNE